MKTAPGEDMRNASYLCFERRVIVPVGWIPIPVGNVPILFQSQRFWQSDVEFIAVTAPPCPENNCRQLWLCLMDELDGEREGIQKRQMAFKLINSVHENFHRLLHVMPAVGFNITEFGSRQFTIGFEADFAFPDVAAHKPFQLFQAMRGSHYIKHIQRNRLKCTRVFPAFATLTNDEGRDFIWIKTEQNRFQDVLVIASAVVADPYLILTFFIKPLQPARIIGNCLKGPGVGVCQHHQPVIGEDFKVEEDHDAEKTSSIR